MKTNENEMANYINQIINCGGSITGSWGISNRVAIKNGLELHVNGLLYQGIVTIMYDEGADAFNVTVGDETFDHVYLDMLVDVIDLHVEKNCNDDEYEKQCDVVHENDIVYFFSKNAKRNNQNIEIIDISGDEISDFDL